MSTITTPNADSDKAPGSTQPLLEARHITQEFTVRDEGGSKGGVVQAVSDVSFEVRQGETLSVVGETGSGKSTLARAILAAPKPISGEVLFRGVDLLRLSRREMFQTRRHMQLIFQDPFTALDPKWKVFDIVEEPLIAYGLGGRAERRRRASELMDLVGLDPAIFGNRRPRQLSGGQCQRVGIARALTLSPSLIVCDEVVSSLDVLIQAQILNLFEDLHSEFGLSYLFIAHDLALVRQISDRVAVMHLGKIVEIGAADLVYNRSLHPYTAALLASIPDPDPDSAKQQGDGLINGEPPSPIDPPSGCRFRTRCPRAEERCAQEEPLMRQVAVDHSVACHFPLRDGGEYEAGEVKEANPR